MATIPFGLCHTFTYENKKATDVERIPFPLDPTMNYRIIIHDPKFYHVLPRSLFPRIFLQYTTEQNMKEGYYETYEISVTEHLLLNRPEQPCEEEEEDYNFLECVKTSQARMVGCRPPWDIWSPPTIPLCQTMDQLQQYENIDIDLLGITKQKAFVRRTGCNLPCNYKVSEVLFGLFLRI